MYPATPVPPTLSVAERVMETVNELDVEGMLKLTVGGNVSGKVIVVEALAAGVETFPAPSFAHA